MSKDTPEWLRENLDTSLEKLNKEQLIKLIYAILIQKAEQKEEEETTPIWIILLAIPAILLFAFLIFAFWSWLVYFARYIFAPL